MAPTDQPPAPTTSTDVPSTSVPPVTVPPVSKVEEVKDEVEEKVEETIESLTAARNKILDEHGGIESNVGLGHDYWEMGNRLRALWNKVK